MRCPGREGNSAHAANLTDVRAESMMSVLVPSAVTAIARAPRRNGRTVTPVVLGWELSIECGSACRIWSNRLMSARVLSIFAHSAIPYFFADFIRQGRGNNPEVIRQHKRLGSRIQFLTSPSDMDRRAGFP